MTRRGRKRNPKAKRHKTTRKGRSSDVGPTPELLAKKVMAVGGIIHTPIAIRADKIHAKQPQISLPRNIDITMSESVLGRLYANQLIDESEYIAGQELQIKYWRSFGIPAAKSRDYSKYLGGFDPEARMEPRTDEERASWRNDCLEILHDLSRNLKRWQYGILLDVTAFDSEIPRKTDYMIGLRTGFSRLIFIFSGGSHINLNN